jgi:hypothetical protein
LLKYGYAFGFFRTYKSGEGWKNDPLIGETISKIIRDFISTHGPEVVLLYHCDYSDRKQKGQDKTFERWYQNSAVNHQFIKKRIEVDIVNNQGIQTEYFIGYLTSCDNPGKLVVEIEFARFAESLTIGKPHQG